MIKLGALFPLGGPEELGGYKGYGLTFLGNISKEIYFSFCKSMRIII